MDQLRAVYGQWRAEYERRGEEWTYGTFDEWQKTHVYNVVATTAGSGADEIAGMVRSLPSGAGVHLFGHSMGGAAVLEYLNRVRRIQINLDKGVLYSRDVLRGYQARLKSAILIDAADTAMPEPGFASWAAHRGITVLDIDTPNDYVDHDPIPGVEHHADKYDYGDPLNDYGVPRFATAFDDLAVPMRNSARKPWHEYTATHMSHTARRLIGTLWR